MVMSFDDEGGIAKMIANPPTTARDGAWVLPFWREMGGAADCRRHPELHGQAGVLLTRDQARCCSGFLGLGFFQVATAVLARDGRRGGVPDAAGAARPGRRAAHTGPGALLLRFFGLRVFPGGYCRSGARWAARRSAGRGRSCTARPACCSRGTRRARTLG